MKLDNVAGRCQAARRNIACFAGALSLLALTLSAPPARAAECLLPPVSVPGLYGAPQWFTSGSLSVRKELDDPRWGGAPITAFANDSVGSTASYRALVYGNELSVSFQALADNNGTSSGDIIYLGISTNAGGTTGKIVAITPRDSGTTDPVAMNSGLDYQLIEKNSAAGAWVASSVTTPPSWLTAVHTWRNSPVGAVWAINLKVDLATLGLAAASGFHMGMAMNVTNSAGAVAFHTPDYAAATALVAGTLLPADATTWPEYSPRGTVCPTGVSISPYAIGTTSAAGRTVVDDSANTFFADVENIPAPITNTPKILARFSIANWGSTVADPDAGWTAFSTSTAGNGYVPDATNGSWTHPAPAPASSTSARIGFTCAVPSGSTYCPKITASSPNRDQCLLVELKAAAGNPNIKFQNAAARQNMSFAALSTVDRDAAISIKGLQKVTGQAMDRDLYVYVQTSNMPAPGSTPLFLPAKEMEQARRYAEAPPPLPQPQVPEQEMAGKLRAAGGAPKDGSVFMRDERSVPVLSPDQAMMEVWPTYRVHVYYDTGKKQVIDGSPRPVLAPLVPFGLFLSHDGPLYGFTHALRGLGGVTLEEIAPNFYKVRVKNEGTIRVAATVTAVERPGTPGGSENPNSCCCRPAPVHVNVRGCFCSVPAAPTSGAGLAGLLASLPLLAFGLRRRRAIHRQR
jgi:hypothetical protein